MHVICGAVDELLFRSPADELRADRMRPPFLGGGAASGGVLLEGRTHRVQSPFPSIISGKKGAKGPYW